MTHTPVLGDDTRAISLRAFAKINLALDLVGLRADGYTEIATVFQSVDLHDEIKLTVHPQPGPTEISVIGAELGPAERNLCWRAVEALRTREEFTNRITVKLKKQIPIGGGLGGGSSDAATVLWGLSDLIGASDPAASIECARLLGADVPYFLELGTVLGTGRGDDLAVWPDLPRLPVVLAALGPPLATADVFRRARGALTTQDQPPKISRLWRHLQGASPGLPPVWNDLTKSAVQLRPEIDRLLGHLVALGGVASMSGSGCVVFGLFESEPDAEAAAVALRRNEPAAWVWQAWTLPRQAARAQRRAQSHE